MSTPVNNMAYPYIDRSSAFQPYIQFNNDIEKYQPQMFSVAGDGTLAGSNDGMKTFTELTSIPPGQGVSDLQRLSLEDPFAVRMLPNAYFQPFSTPQPFAQYGYAGNSGCAQFPAIANILRPHPVQPHYTFSQHVPPKRETPEVRKPRTPPPRREVSVVDDDDGEEETLFVNAKQFARIMQRREVRAKMEREGRISKARKKYLHESRHLHALSRTRGIGGKFGGKIKREMESIQWLNDNLFGAGHPGLPAPQFIPPTTAKQVLISLPKKVPGKRGRKKKILTDCRR